MAYNESELNSQWVRDLPAEQIQMFYTSYWVYGLLWVTRQAVLGTVLLLGLGGNLFSLILLHGRCVRGRMLSMYMHVLVIVNTAYLLVVTLPEFVGFVRGREHRLQNMHEGGCKTWNICLFLFSILSSWMLVLLAADHIIVVSKLVNGSRSSGERSVMCAWLGVLVILVIACSIANVPWVRFDNLLVTFQIRSNCVNRHNWWNKILGSTTEAWVFSLLHAIIPFWVLLGALAAVLSKLKRYHSMKRQEQRVEEGGAEDAEGQGKRHTGENKEEEGQGEGNIGCEEGESSCQTRKQQNGERGEEEQASEGEEQGKCQTKTQEEEEEEEGIEMDDAEKETGQEAHGVEEHDDTHAQRDPESGVVEEAVLECKEPGQLSFEECRLSQVYMCVAEILLFLLFAGPIEHLAIFINLYPAFPPNTVSFLRNEVHKALGDSLQLLFNAIVAGGHFYLYMAVSNQFRGRFVGLFCRSKIVEEEKLPRRVQLSRSFSGYTQTDDYTSYTGTSGFSQVDEHI